MFRKWAKNDEASYFHASSRNTFHVLVSPGMNFFTKNVIE
jgi:hypothetical protein